MDERIRLAVDKAEQAFWASIAESFPEAQSGDLPPDAVGLLMQSMTDVVKFWVHFNVPGGEAAQLFD